MPPHAAAFSHHQRCHEAAASLPPRPTCIRRLEPRLHSLQHLIHQGDAKGGVVACQPGCQAGQVRDLQRKRNSKACSSSPPARHGLRPRLPAAGRCRPLAPLACPSAPDARAAPPTCLRKAAFVAGPQQRLHQVALVCRPGQAPQLLQDLQASSGRGCDCAQRSGGCLQEGGHTAVPRLHAQPGPPGMQQSPELHSQGRPPARPAPGDAPPLLPL